MLHRFISFFLAFICELHLVQFQVWSVDTALVTAVLIVSELNDFSNFEPDDEENFDWYQTMKDIS